MRAAVLHAFGTPLTLEERPDPEAGPGDVVVDVAAAAVLPYTDEVLSGARNYALTLPVVPGCGGIGRVHAVGPDATHLQPGDWVLLDPTVRSRDGLPSPDITLQGWSARGEGGLLLQRHFGQGAFAQRTLVPLENAVPVGRIDPAEAGRWAALIVCLVPYGGLRAVDLQAGETVLVSGATGNFGSAAVAVALAMGAAQVVAPGRNTAMLTELESRFGPRVRTVTLTGDEDADRVRMQQAADAPIDVVLDLLPPEAPTTAVRAAMTTVREHGRVVLMGGVGMLGGDPLALPYAWIMRNNITIRGQWMCLPEDNLRLIALARAGLLDLGQFDVSPFPLDDVHDAVAHAAATDGRFRITVLTP